MLGENLSIKEYLESLSGEAQAAAKSELFNIFRANPWLSRLYGFYFAYTGNNPFEFKNIQPRSEFFFNDDSNSNPKKGKPTMATKPAPICTHIKPTGHRCGSPALRGEIFCYFHQRMIRGVRTPPKSRLHPIAILDDPASIQASLMEIINALVRNTIDYHRAQLILRALHMAAKNSRHVHFNLRADSMVDEVPKYPAPREKRQRLVAPPPLPFTDREKQIYDEQCWDWDEIRRKIAANTHYDPRLERLEKERLAKTAAAQPEVNPALPKPPQSVKLPLQPNSSVGELASSILAPRELSF